jgi:hypothetical protein
VAGIVHDDVETAGVGDDPGDACFDGGVGGDIEFDRAQVDAVFLGEGCCIGNGLGVAGFGGAHAGINGMAGPCERAGGQAPKPLEAPVMTMTCLLIDPCSFFEIGWVVAVEMVGFAGRVAAEIKLRRGPS